MALVKFYKCHELMQLKMVLEGYLVCADLFARPNCTRYVKASSIRDTFVTKNNLFCQLLILCCAVS